MTTTPNTPPLDVASLRATLSGDLFTPGDTGWDEARTPWNLAVDQRPAAVACPADADDVRAVVRFAVEHGLRVAPQGTGHGSGALADLSGAILVRMGALRGVRIDPDARMARAEAGALWEDVVAPAAQYGLTALHGSSPDVGVAGYTLGGGIGWLARKHGLASSSVTALEVVTPDGRLVRTDAQTEPELFWAIRGGGGNFGIVVALEFSLYPIREVFAGWLVWPWEDAERVLRAWGEWASTAPDEATSVGRILQLPALPDIPEPLRGRNLVVIEVAFLGNATEGSRLMEPLVGLGPEMNTLATVPANALSRLHADPEGPTPGLGDGLLLDALPAEAVQAFVATTGPDSGSPFVSTEIRHLGGALGRPAPGGGALSMIDGAFAVYSIGIPMDAEQRSLIDRHLETLRGTMAPWGRARGYLNFTERPVDAGSLFGADDHERLRRVRARFDPQALLVANHAIDAG